MADSIDNQEPTKKPALRLVKDEEPKSELVNFFEQFANALDKEIESILNL